MLSKTITKFPDEIERCYQNLSIVISTDVLFINSECTSGYFTVDLPKFYKMLLVEYVNNVSHQYVNSLIHDLFTLCKTYIVDTSKENLLCSFKHWIYHNVCLLNSGCDLGVYLLVYPFISHGIILYNIDDYDAMLSPQSSAYRGYLLKSSRERYEQRDLDYLSQFSMRFTSDIHRFYILLRRVISSGM